MLTGFKWAAGTKFGGQIFKWGITLIVIRLLSPDDYGLMAMSTVFMVFMLMFSEAGLAPALIQKENLDEMSLRQAFGMVVIINLGLFTILNIFAPAFASFFEDDRLIPILHVMSLQFLFIIFSTIPGVLLYRELKFKYISLISLTSSVSGGFLTLTLAFADYGVWALVYGNLFVLFMSTVLINIVAPFHKLPIFSMQGMRSFLFFGSNITISRFLWLFLTQVDIIIIGKLLGKEILGFYSVAKHLAAMPIQRVSAIVNQVTFPVFSREQHNRQDLSRIVIKAMRALSFVAFPVLWGISCTAHEITPLFLGQKWESAIFPLQLLTLVMPLRMLGNFLPSVTDAVGRPDISMTNVLIASLIFPPAIFIGASQWGLIGVVVAVTIASPVTFLISTSRSFSALGLRMKDLIWAIMPIVISVSVMYISVWSVSWLLEGYVSRIAKLIVMIVVGVLIYGILTFIINKQGYREVVNFIRQR